MFFHPKDSLSSSVGASPGLGQTHLSESHGGRDTTRQTLMPCYAGCGQAGLGASGMSDSSRTEGQSGPGGGFLV